MWPATAGQQCVHASLPRQPRAPRAAAPAAAAAPLTLSGSIASRRPPRPHAPSPSLVSKIDSSVACLWLLTPLSAGTAALAALVAVSTNSWLLTEENLPNVSYNGTGDDYVSQLTISGLWRMCRTEPGGTVFHCGDIPYFPLGQYVPDPSDSTAAIPYIVTQSAVPLLLAVVGQAVGCVCCALGYCVRGRRIYTFVAGVIFIVSGLIMLTGIIMYISAFKTEIGHKLYYMSVFEAPRMSYSYGYSFVLYLSGFVGVELSGTLAIFLFLQWYQRDWVVELTERAKLECRAWDRQFAYVERDTSSLLERRLMKRETYPPTASTSATPPERRRLFLDEDVAPCSVHRNRRNHSSASLKDLSSSTLYGFPAAPRPTETFFDEFKELPPSANTLSGLRSASIFQSQASIASGRFLDGSARAARDEELVTFAVGAGEAARRDRALAAEAFRRTTPV